MLQRLPDALAAHEELSRTAGFTCQWEPNFDEIYQQPKEVQRDIREANPDVEHCEKLLVSATACDAACPFNPRIGRKGELNVIVAGNADLISHAFELHNRERGAYLDPLSLQLWEKTALRMARDNFELARDRRMAKITAFEIIDLLGKALGNKK